jgi:hypothetical protein
MIEPLAVCSTRHPDLRWKIAAPPRSAFLPLQIDRHGAIADRSSNVKIRAKVNRPIAAVQLAANPGNNP